MLSQNGIHFGKKLTPLFHSMNKKKKRKLSHEKHQFWAVLKGRGAGLNRLPEPIDGQRKPILEGLKC